MNTNRKQINSASFRLLTATASCVVSGYLSKPLQAGVLEEVMVTAQKREESIQDVGISVTAFSGDQLQNLGMTNTVDITQ